MIRVFYKITPHSVLFFRDSRPFKAGEQSLARLQFPPRLTPFLGALRTKYLEVKARDENRRVKDIFSKYEEQVKSISIFWFSIMMDGEPILPVPFDLFAEWKPLSEDRFVTEIGNSDVPILQNDNPKEHKKPQYITVDKFMGYLKGENLSPDDFISADELWRLENRVGLTLAPGTKISERSRFYRITVARFKQGVEFIVGVEMGNDVELPHSFTTRLGGEGHIAAWGRVDDKAFKIKKDESHVRFKKAVALTHVPIGNSSGGPKIVIKNWCINGLDNVGGWDYRNNRPKPLMKALKPGAVLLPETNGSIQCDIYELDFSGAKIMVVKDMIGIYEKDRFYLDRFSPELGEPDTLLAVKT